MTMSCVPHDFSQPLGYARNVDEPYVRAHSGWPSFSITSAFDIPESMLTMLCPRPVLASEQTSAKAESESARIGVGGWGGNSVLLPRSETNDGTCPNGRLSRALCKMSVGGDGAR